MTDEIRKDIEEIITLPDSEFQEWYTTRKEATERMIGDYRLFASIPDIRYQSSETMIANTHVRDHLEILEAGRACLERIDEMRKNYIQEVNST